MNSDVLVLNRSFYAVAITDFQRAFKLVYSDRAYVIDEDYRTYNFQDWREMSEYVKEHPSGYVHTPSFKIAIPEVISLRYYDRLPVNEIKFTRRNIYDHYGYRCCYCGKNFPPSELNLDHVIPRSRGGKTDWNNIVTACIACNLRKGNKLPNEANMDLLIQPTKPKWRGGLSLLLRPSIKIKASWQKFVDSVYWNIELEK